MKIRVSWEGGGWESDELTEYLSKEKIEAEIAELEAKIAEDKAENINVSFSGGRRCTREVLHAMQEQYADKWSPADQFQFVNRLMADSGTHVQHHLYMSYMLEVYPGKLGSWKRLMEVYGAIEMTVGIDTDEQEAIHGLNERVTTYIDDLVRSGSCKADLGVPPGEGFSLWQIIDHEKLAQVGPPRIRREWEGRFCFCSRAIRLKEMGVEPA